MFESLDNGARFTDADGAVWVAADMLSILGSEQFIAYSCMTRQEHRRGPLRDRGARWATEAQLREWLAESTKDES